MYKLKTYDELTFADDYLFCQIMQDENICKGVIKTLLGIEVEKIEYLNKQQEFSPSLGSRGIRMDVYVKNSEQIFDLEIQTCHFTDLPKRARYYQGLIDIDILEKNHDYKQLKESFIVFICTKDPFGFGLPCYTVEQICKEDKNANDAINDRTHKIYYNAEGWAKSENKEVKAFLKFLTTQAADTDLTKAIETAVYTSKGRELWRKEFMTVFEQIDDATAEGIAIGEERKAYETAENLFNIGLSIEQISYATGLSIEQIEDIADEMGLSE